MSLQPTSNSTPGGAPEQPRGETRSGLTLAFRRAVGFLPSVVRLLMGFLLIINGWTWIHRADPGGYLAEAISTVLASGGTVGVYRPFLESVVTPNVGVFSVLVGWGEFLSGVSLFFGAASRVGATVAAFHFINYGLMGGYVSLLVHGVLVAMLAITVYWRSGRQFGLDRWLYRRWPTARVW